MTRGRSLWKKRSIQGKSNHGAILRQPCRYYSKGACTRSPCEYWHPPECQFYKTETVSRVGDKCMFPHHKVDEQPNKKAKERLLFPKKKSKRRQECCGNCESVPQLGCVSQDSEAVVSQRGKQSWRNQMQKVLGPIRRVRFTQSTLRQASIRENKGPSLGKIQVKLPHQRSPYAVKFEDRAQEETARQQRCAQSEAWNLAKNIYKLKEKDKTTILLALGRNGFCWLHQ